MLVSNVNLLLRSDFPDRQDHSETLRVDIDSVSRDTGSVVDSQTRPGGSADHIDDSKRRKLNDGSSKESGSNVIV